MPLLKHVSYTFHEDPRAPEIREMRFESRQQSHGLSTAAFVVRRNGAPGVLARPKNVAIASSSIYNKCRNRFDRPAQSACSERSQQPSQI
jgi:hypothetical protein